MTIVLFIFSLLSAVVGGVYSILGLVNKDIPSFVLYLNVMIACILMAIAFFQLHKAKNKVDEQERDLLAQSSKIRQLENEIKELKSKQTGTSVSIEKIKKQLDEITNNEKDGE